jgi:2-hydroxy-3-keto-5-methylthiopentenyl-1-phosphate phosphatase
MHYRELHVERLTNITFSLSKVEIEVLDKLLGKDESRYAFCKKLVVDRIYEPRQKIIRTDNGTDGQPRRESRLIEDFE